MSNIGKSNVIPPDVAKVVRQGGELRQDLVTGKWVIVAKGRAKRPNDYNKNKDEAVKKPPKYLNDCPFCNLAEYPQSPDTLRLPDDDDTWRVHIFENKYPALLPRDDMKAWSHNSMYRTVEAVGFHELLATRWHNQEEWNMTVNDISVVLEALVLRVRQLRVKPFVNYVHIIRNHGKEAGASLEHPHYQLFTLPVVPSDIVDMLQGARGYKEANGKNVFEVVLDNERQSGERIVWENDLFTAFCPYASRVPYEVTIMPRYQQSDFDAMSPDEREALAETLFSVLRKIFIGMHDAPYNLVVQTAPCDTGGTISAPELNGSFRWHISVYPRLNTWGGFEIGTGLEISDVVPEESAEYLRNLKIS